ncbi:ParD-like family protein [Paucibacter sp. AS339]|uniref:ParD-like family protein n=1 Tax=Paucibacter hankyongi TaxID=3133434 RepID=UPI0030B24774
MGIVKISETMHESLRVASGALSRSINAQAEHWMRIGMLAELYPDLDHREISQLLIRAEQNGGLDLASLAGLAANHSPATPNAPRAGRKSMQ